MRYEVPQFIEVEDKIFGPLTFKQFIYLAGAGGVCVILYVLYESFFITIIFGGPVVLLAVALSFYEINNQPFVDVMRAAMEYALNRKLYLWTKRYHMERLEKKGAESQPALGAKPTVSRISQNRLKELAYNLDMQEHSFSNEDDRLHGTLPSQKISSEKGAGQTEGGRTLPSWIKM